MHSVCTFFHQYVCSLGIEPTTLCAANAMLYHWATGTFYYAGLEESIFISRNFSFKHMQHSGYKQGFHKFSSRRNENIQTCVSTEFLEKIIRSCVKQQYERLQSPTNKCHHALLFSITRSLLNPSMAMKTSSGHILPQCLDQWAHGIITVSLSCLSVAFQLLSQSIGISIIHCFFISCFPSLFTLIASFFSDQIEK